MLQSSIEAWVVEPSQLGNNWSTLPIVVVGNGPIGIACVRELLARDPDLPIVVYGEEPHPPYNRIQLSSLLSGKIDFEALFEPVEPASLPASTKVEKRFGMAVTRLYPKLRLVEDSLGRLQAYRALILATGSKPHVPNIPGTELGGVFTFRSLDDAQRLLARQVRSRHTVVLGGGLLGVEAAFGMRRYATCVTLVEHESRLLPSWTDEGASRVLEHHLMELGIKPIVGDGICRILGKTQVEGVELRSGRFIPCDTLIVACGIRPRIELALAAGLAVGRGIRVNDFMQTSMPDIYAVGECAEHRGQIYGLIAPGLEQAKTLADCILARPKPYVGSVAACRLKVAGCPVFSAGPVGIQEEPFSGRELVFCDPGKKLYRKLLIRRLRLIGAVGVGPWEDAIEQAVAQRKRLWPWQLWRFRRSGFLWSKTRFSRSPNAQICQCTGATYQAIVQAMQQGANDLPSLIRTTGAGSGCGSCRPLLSELLGTAVQPIRWHRLVVTSSLLAASCTLALMLAPPVPYPDTVQLAWRWDKLWRDGFYKQASGYALLGLVLAALLLSLRKRLRKLQTLGSFDTWRIAHVLFGLLAPLGLLLHTGGRLGSGLDLALALCFALTLGLGSACGLVTGHGHRIGGALATSLKHRFTWWHLLAFWPLPVLLGFHILKVYWY